MRNITLGQDRGVLTITLARGKANALNCDLIGELWQAVDAASTDRDVRAIVLASGLPRLFSAGFDVKEVFGYDRDRMTAFFQQFTSLHEAIYHCPKGVVAALNGHTFAGGAILALACDLRVMSEESEFGFALNEIDLGLVVSAGVCHVLADAVGLGHTREILLTGQPVSPRRAYEIGLVHELAPADQVLERAQEKARVLAAKPPLALAEMKRALLEACGPTVTGSERVEEFVEIWFAPEATECRRRLTERMA